MDGIQETYQMSNNQVQSNLPKAESIYKTFE
jgi:hypothetical protein